VKKPPANAAIVLKLLPRYYPDAHCALDHKNAFELLIATILSAQCTDERVNIVTKGLFAKYPTPEKMAKAKQEDLEELIRSAGFYKNKAKNIKACAQALVETHHGQVPDKMEDLVALAGVGRKTANVVLGNAFDIASGIVVDTHVTRLSNRLGWVKGEDAVAIEKRLCEFVPKDHWIKLSHELIFHGRQICKARKPLCERCFLLEHCPQKGV
jgi:endonuclease-3